MHSILPVSILDPSFTDLHPVGGGTLSSGALASNVSGARAPVIDQSEADRPRDHPDGTTRRVSW